MCQTLLELGLDRYGQADTERNQNVDEVHVGKGDEEPGTANPMNANRKVD